MIVVTEERSEREESENISIFNFNIHILLIIKPCCFMF